jgi:hypothetical protein
VARPARHARRGVPIRPLAHAAGDPSDTISDYKFAPAAITVHVGDTVTWTNDGPTEHSATASNGSFDTGLLKKGASASHTFAQAGTFAYICSIHPFMHGTVVVLATAASSTPRSSSGSSGARNSSATAASATGSSTATGSQTTSGQLPVTGLNLLRILLAGAVLLSVGLALRRGSRDLRAAAKR